jgi:hypothetical protein
MARKSDRCGEGGPGTPPAHLAARQKAYEQMANGGPKGRGYAGGLSFNPDAFHKPGSNKK